MDDELMICIDNVGPATIVNRIGNPQSNRQSAIQSAIPNRQ
jgi:hypothetical protein